MSSNKSPQGEEAFKISFEDQSASFPEEVEYVTANSLEELVGFPGDPCSEEDKRTLRERLKKLGRF